MRRSKKTRNPTTTSHQRKRCLVRSPSPAQPGRYKNIRLILYTPTSGGDRAILNGVVVGLLAYCLWAANLPSASRKAWFSSSLPMVTRRHCGRP